VLIGPLAVLRNTDVRFPTGLTVSEVTRRNWAVAEAPYACASICLGTVIGFACLGLAGALNADDCKPQMRRYARMARQPKSDDQATAPHFDLEAPRMNRRQKAVRRGAILIRY
jgi:hypothetical protein